MLQTPDLLLLSRLFMSLSTCCCSLVCAPTYLSSFCPCEVWLYCCSSLTDDWRTCLRFAEETCMAQLEPSSCVVSCEGEIMHDWSSHTERSVPRMDARGHLAVLPLQLWVPCSRLCWLLLSFALLHPECFLLFMGFQALVILLLPASLCGCVLHGWYSHVLTFMGRTFYLVGHLVSPAQGVFLPSLAFGTGCFWGKVYIIRKLPWMGKRYQ